MRYLLFGVFLISSFFGIAQRIEAIEEEGDRYFNNFQYIKAITLYKAAIELQPTRIRVQYKLGNSYRLIQDYESASFYYEAIFISGDIRFPLAGYYFGLMQKLKGKYSEALVTFKQFDEFLVTNKLHEKEEYRFFFKQSKMEIDGCQLALNQITMPHPDHGFELLPDPLNSEFNDYAAFSLGVDSIVCLTSARAEGKGQLQDNQFGESYADLFRFVRSRYGGWSAYNPRDRFEDVINTKWGDGSGSFNRDRTKFYYTNCEASLGDVCHIYVSKLTNGTWSTPQALNMYINESGYSSKHPNLSPKGDTLFYVSDRIGGKGGSDIWMSLNAGGDNWGPSVNLGDQINTPFNELSPFYDQNERVLFFSSDGHRGFGGYDIYIAKGNSFKAAEIYNAGIPFNSNKDDIFFFLGNKAGYLSSNRDGGLGKFDIYGFKLKSKQEIVSEVSTESTIAGRNSLFTDDYNFDSREPEIVNQIISRLLASSFSEIDLLLTDEQLAVFNSLSQDDKDRIDKIVNARLRKMTSTMLRSIRTEDDSYYQSLDTDKRRKVDAVVSSHIKEQGLGSSVRMSNESRTFYTSIGAEDREKLDILLAERLKSAKDYTPATQNYSSYGASDQQVIDEIISKYLEQKKGLQNITLSIAQKDFYRNQLASQPLKINAAIRERLLTLNTSDKYKLTRNDRTFYEALPQEGKNNLWALTSTFMVADFNSFDEQLKKENIKLYEEFGSENKLSLDRLVLKQIVNQAKADTYMAEASYSRQELEAAYSSDPDETYQRLIKLKPQLTPDQKISLERFVHIIYPSYLREIKPVFIQEVPVVTEVKREPFYSSNAAADAPKKEKYYDLSPKTVEAYDALPFKKKLIIDKVIALAYINNSYKDEILETEDRQELKSLSSTEKQHVEILAKNLRGEDLNTAEVAWRLEAFTYYNNLAPSRKALINRLVLAKSFERPVKQFQLNREDGHLNGKLTIEEKAIMSEVTLFRNSNERILTENLAVESKDVDEEPVDTITLTKKDPKSESSIPTQTIAKNSTPSIRFELPAFEKHGGKIDISGRLVDAQTGKPMVDYPIILVENDNEETVIEEYTNANGEFVFLANAVTAYINTYPGANAEKISLAGVQIRQKKKEDEGKIFTNSMRFYFNLDSYFLRSEAKRMLEEIVAIYKKSPMRIEIESHTDNTGGSDYNKILSKNRAHSSMEFLVINGVKKSDIGVIWHGHEKPVAANNNPYGRQLNRRVDVRIVTSQPVDFESGDFYLVKPEATLAQISKAFNLSIQEMMTLNGLSAPEVTAYQPLRVRTKDFVEPDLNLVVPANITRIKDFRYTVKPGEDIHAIAVKFNVPEELLMEINNLTSPRVTPGLKIKIYPE